MTLRYLKNLVEPFLTTEMTQDIICLHYKRRWINLEQIKECYYKTSEVVSIKPCESILNKYL